MNANIDGEVGLGASVVITNDIPTDKVWEVLLIKIEQPNLFLPVSDVVYRPSDDGLGTYREMSLGPNRVLENIYSDKSKYEVIFVVINEENEHVNVIHTNEETGVRTLEFYKRDSNTKERLHWDAPKKMAIDGIQKVLEMARRMGDA